MTLATEFLIASGYTGEATETFARPSDATCPTPIERVVGVPLKPYIEVSWTYHFDKQSAHSSRRLFFWHAEWTKTCGAIVPF
jgi:hypothetical protein